MSKIDRATIEMIERNLEYIKLGLEKDHGEANKAQWLFYLIKSYEAHVDGEMRAQATAERKKLNGKGYSGKADH